MQTSAEDGAGVGNDGASTGARSTRLVLLRAIQSCVPSWAGVLCVKCVSFSTFLLCCLLYIFGPDIYFLLLCLGFKVDLNVLRLSQARPTPREIAAYPGLAAKFLSLIRNAPAGGAGSGLSEKDVTPYIHILVGQLELVVNKYTYLSRRCTMPP